VVALGAVSRGVEAQEAQAAQIQSVQAPGSEAKPPDLAPNLEYAAASELPDSPSTVVAQQQATPKDDSAGQPRQETKSAGDEQNTQQPAPAQTNQSLQRPVGTAAAEAPRVSGITAAEPAGVAIAPAKQHRVRTIAIKVGAILGASAALGTVIALTAATPSKPPGAH